MEVITTSTTYSQYETKIKNSLTMGKIPHIIASVNDNTSYYYDVSFIYRNAGWSQQDQVAFAPVSNAMDMWNIIIRPTFTEISGVTIATSSQMKLYY